jgi:S1-C subfamily serine protease
MGDVITRINGNSIPDFDRLTANVAQHEPGQVITLDVLRGEQTRTFQVTLGSWDLRQPR